MTSRARQATRPAAAAQRAAPAYHHGALREALLAAAEALLVSEAWARYMAEGKPARKDAWKPRYVADLQAAFTASGDATLYDVTPEPVQDERQSRMFGSRIPYNFRVVLPA
jgi:hypothetical protein